MLNVEALVNFLLIDAEPTAVQMAITRARVELARLYGALEHIDVTALDSELALNSNTWDVLFASFEQQILERARESVLDALDTDWRNITGTPRNYLWRGEVADNAVQLYPLPASDGRLQVIKQLQPDADTALWHNVFLVLETIRQLCISDTRHARLPFAEIATVLLSMMRRELIRRFPKERRI
jgi:hypothetical protein